MGDRGEGRHHNSQSHVVRISSSSAINTAVDDVSSRPGPPKTSSGASSTYFIPWRVSLAVTPYRFTPDASLQDKVSLQDKLDQILAWIDMPLEKRPQFIMGMCITTLDEVLFSFLTRIAYEPSLDQAGHLAGPTSKLVDVGVELRFFQMLLLIVTTSVYRKF